MISVTIPQAAAPLLPTTNPTNTKTSTIRTISFFLSVFAAIAISLYEFYKELVLPGNYRNLRTSLGNSCCVDSCLIMSCSKLPCDTVTTNPQGAESWVQNREYAFSLTQAVNACAEYASQCHSGNLVSQMIFGDEAAGIAILCENELNAKKIGYTIAFIALIALSLIGLLKYSSQVCCSRNSDSSFFGDGTPPNYGAGGVNAPMPQAEEDGEKPLHEGDAQPPSLQEAIDAP